VPTVDERRCILENVGCALEDLKSGVNHLRDAVKLDDPDDEMKGDRGLRLLYEQAIDIHLQGSGLRARLELELSPGTQVEDERADVAPDEASHQAPAGE
jgi:hypothetical protein